MYLIISAIPHLLNFLLRFLLLFPNSQYFLPAIHYRNILIKLIISRTIWIENFQKL